MVTSLFQEFSSWWKTNKITNVEEQLQTLKRFSSVFKQFFETTEPSRINIFTRRLRELDTSTVYPLLLFLFGEVQDTLEPAERDGIVADLESYLIRRMICGLSGKSYNRHFLSIMQRLKTSGELSRAIVQQILLESSAPTFRWPNNHWC